MKTDVVIVGSGVAGLYCALNLPKDLRILMITKNAANKSDSFWRRAVFACCGMTEITIPFLKIPCGRDIMKTTAARWIL